MNDLEADFLLHLLHAADVLEIDFGPFDVLRRRFRLLLAPGRADFSFDHFAVVFARADAQSPRKLGVGERAIQFDRATILRHGVLDFPDAGEQSRVEREGAGGCFGVLHQVFDDHERVAGLGLSKERARQAELHRQAVGRLREAFAKFLFRLGGVSVREQRVGKMQAQRGVVG